MIWNQKSGAFELHLLKIALGRKTRLYEGTIRGDVDLKSIQLDRDLRSAEL